MRPGRADFPRHRLDLEIGADFLADRAFIEISWHLCCFAESNNRDLQWRAAILDNLADGHSIGAMRRVECDVRGSSLPWRR
jgi:hypothetical protein